MFIIPGIRISAGRKGIIYYIIWEYNYELDLHYDYVFPTYLFLMLTNKTDDGVKCYFTPTISSQKVPTFFQYICGYTYIC